MTTKRVLEVFGPPDGGVAEHVLRLAEGLGAHGWSVDVAGPAGSEYLPRLRATGATVHELPFVRPPGRQDVAVARGLRAIDRAGRYDVVHAHSSKAGGVARAVLPGAARRVVYTPHCFAFSGGFAGRGRAFYRTLERGLLRRTRAIVAVSAWERDEALRELGAPAELVRVVYNGAPPCRPGDPDPGIAAFAAGRPVAGMIAVLRPQKDPIGLLRAAAALRDRGELPLAVVIVGNGELREAVLAEIARLDLAAHATLLPFTGDVQAYLRALDLFVLPSLWESLPISIIEAMACGLPVLGTTVSGVPEVVTDGVTGRLVAPGDPAALAAALAAAMADPAELARNGAAGRAVFEERFRLEPMIAAVAGLYEEVAGLKPGHG